MDTDITAGGEKTSTDSFSAHGIKSADAAPVKPRTPRTSPDFGEVLAAAQAGADWAMTSLFRRFNPSLVRYLRSADPGSYEDLAADVWLSVANALAGFHGMEDDFRGWLFTIARNRLIDSRRRAARRPVAFVADEDLTAYQVAYDPGEELAERLSAQSAVSRLVSALPESQSQVVLLRVLGGLDVADVARIMGRSPGWVRVNQHRALVRLAGVIRRLRDQEAG